MVDYCEREEAITWIQCCNISVKNNYNKIKRGRTVADWYLALHRYDSIKFRRSKRGRESYLEISPFMEDELLLTQFKSWARIDLEHLSVQKSQDFINTKLLADWTAHQLCVNIISYPVAEFIVTRWMR